MTLKPDHTAAILLAAGAASRFGGDKLSAPLRGASVIDHAAAALAAAQCTWLAVITSPGAKMAAPAGFEHVINPNAKDGLSTSVRIGVRWAEARGATAVLIALADMPFIESSHYPRLFEAASKNRNQCSYTLSRDGRSPPALFGARWFSQLRDLSGDRGANKLLKAQPKNAGVAAPEETLADIDTRDDLNRFEKTGFSAIR